MYVVHTGEGRGVPAHAHRKARLKTCEHTPDTPIPRLNIHISVHTYTHADTCAHAQTHAHTWYISSSRAIFLPTCPRQADCNLVAARRRHSRRHSSRIFAMERRIKCARYVACSLVALNFSSSYCRCVQRCDALEYGFEPLSSVWHGFFVAHFCVCIYHACVNI
jgi:hypothetical protein